MGKKKHPEHVNNERWLVSYADFITLLFAFFVVLFSSAPKDDSNTRTITAASQNMNTTFAIFSGGGSKLHGKKMKARGDGVELHETDEEPLVSEPEQDEVTVNKQRNLSTADEPYKATSRMRDSMMQEFYQDLINANNVEVSMEARGLVISFSEVANFDLGSASVDIEDEEKIFEIVKIIKDRQNLIMIEGHSDGTDEDKGRYDSSMEVSIKRANAVAEILTKYYDIPKEGVSTVGYGRFRPKGDNNSELGRRKNRRVDIVLLKSTPDSKNLAVPSFKPKEEAKENEEAQIAVESLIE